MLAFVDLHAQRRRIGDRMTSAVLEVLEGASYIMGPQVKAFEQQLAEFGGARHAISCANGTDAIVLVLRALKIGPGDAVFCPSFTFSATAEVVALVGATPVFVDVDPATYTMEPSHLQAAIEEMAKEARLVPRAIIAVDLFGQPADYPALEAVALAHGLVLISDSAQGFGCQLNDRQPLAHAIATTTSFFPAKPLGCYGDGGAVLTNDEALADRIDSLRVHGKATKRDLGERTFDHDPKYLNMRVGTNSRLDTMQAAVLIEKLRIFADEIDARNRIAARYSELLAPHVDRVPKVISGGVSTWAQYTIEHQERDRLSAHLKAHGIPTAVYYPVPLHQQPAYAEYPVGPRGMANTEAAALKVLSLPMHPYLLEADQDAVIGAVASFDGAGAEKRA